MGIGGGRCGGGKHGLHVGQAPNPAAGVERPTKRGLPWPLQKHPFGPARSDENAIDGSGKAFHCVPFVLTFG